MFKDTREVKDKIIIVLRRRGPSLPVHVAKEVNLSMLFASAFLSELISDKLIKMSNMRVGSSPIYFIPEHESLLERYSTFLKSKERDAFLMLKEKRFLKDKELEPAIRVALREIKDFAVLFNKNGELYWRYFTAPEKEFQENLFQIKEEIKKDNKDIPIQKEEISLEGPKIEITEEQEKKIEIKEKEIIISNQEEVKEEIKEKTKTIKVKIPKEKSDFGEKIVKFLDKKDIELIDKTNIGKKDFEGNGRINSDLGKIDLLIIAKDKKKISEDDLIIAIQKGSFAQKMVLFLTTGEIDKKAEEFFNQHQGIIKFLKI